MDSTISVSKGCFVFKNGATRANKTAKKATKRKSTNANAVLGKEITEETFYKVYKETWQLLQKHIEQLQQRSYAETLEKLVSFVANDNEGNAEIFDMEEILPAAVLLTGINQPDHLDQFETLSQRIHEKLSASVCVLQSRDSPTIKAAVETMIYNFIEAEQEEHEDRDHKRLRRSQCTMKQLKRWYNNNYPNSKKSADNMDEDIIERDADDNMSTESTANKQRRHTLVVILPDFECFSSKILQDFILILSAYCAELPFVLILGVATAVAAVHNNLAYHVTSKMKLRVFQMQSAPVALNEILEQVILSPKYSFHLSGKTFKFLTHIFLYYDFSIQGFIQGYKYCLMEHFFQGNAYALCTSYSSALTKIKSMTHDDMEIIRRLLSFRPYVESINDCKRIISILTDDNYLKKKLPQLLRDCHMHFALLRTFLEFLTVLVADLPKCPLGKYKRELYALCLSKELNAEPEFKECWQILSFMSKNEFVAKITKAMDVTEVFLKTELLEFELAEDCTKIVTETMTALKELLNKVVTAGMEAKLPPTAKTKESTGDELKQLSSRHDLKERLLQMSKQDKPISDFTKAVQHVLAFIQTEIVVRHLAPLQRAPPLHELFVFSDIATVRRNIIGAPRAALHMALNNPHYYLQCKCCSLQEHTQMLSTLPDLSIAYKLHLESGRMINLFDWLQAFRTIVAMNDDDEGDADAQQEQVDPQIQARFTRAVAELQFLGYIKMSKRKTDHAMRLTW